MKNFVKQTALQKKYIPIDKPFSKRDYVGYIKAIKRLSRLGKKIHIGR